MINQISSTNLHILINMGCSPGPLTLADHFEDTSLSMGDQTTVQQKTLYWVSVISFET
jgi:hypothetical protein